MSLVDSRNFHLPGKSPSRKPIPQIVQPDQQSQVRREPSDYSQQDRQPPHNPSPHSRSRTASSSIFPPAAVELEGSSPVTTNAPPSSYPQQSNQPQILPKRTTSHMASSTSSTNPNVPMRHNSASSLQRSTSSKSGSSPTSYVALMRRQKATVWSDRAQHEDPRAMAQQRAAKARAAAEVSNANPNARGSTSGSTSSITGGVRSKIRHHGAPKAQQYIQTSLPGGGVPIRLSQNEIEEGDSEEDHGRAGTFGIHRRTDSGRSSVGSAGGRHASMLAMTPGATPQQVRSGHSTPPLDPRNAKTSNGPPPQPSSADETPVPDDFRRQDYFGRKAVPSLPNEESGDSAESTDREDSFGEAGKLPLRIRNPEDEEEARKIEAELRRRGSVDERTMTMSGMGRLFIANPDG